MLVCAALVGTTAEVAAPADAATPASGVGTLGAAPTLPILGRPSTPDQDEFYRPPGHLSGKPGELIRSRPSKAYTDPVRLVPVPAKTWQVLYRSTSGTGEANAVSGTVLVPETGWSGPGPRPIVSYTVGTHGLGDQCAPSYQLATGTEQELGLISMALARGWAVAVTDYEGLGTPGDHTYVVQRSEGRAALDVVRAAIELPAAGLAKDAPVAIWGYSQGGGAAGSAAEQADGYAPELHAVGVAAGGVPADLLAVARNLDGSPSFGLLGAAAVGLNAGYPGLRIEKDILNERGRRLFDQLRHECVGEITARNPGHRLSEFTTLADPLAYKPLLERLRENRIGSKAPDMPVLLYHAQLDELIPLAVGRGLFDEYCGRGVRVRFDVIPAAEHVTGAALGGPGAVGWLADRFAGRTAPDACR